MTLHLEGRLCRLIVLALPGVVLGSVAVAAADKQLKYHSRLSVLDRLHEHDQPALPPALRGVRDRHALLVADRHHQHPLVALQASEATHIQARAGRFQRRTGSRKSNSVKHSKHGHRGQEKANGSQKQKVVTESGRCGGLKLKWWIKIKKKCAKAYGADSKWDRQKLDGKCQDAWDKCNTGFYAVCCSQPIGPRNLQAYCERRDIERGEAAQESGGEAGNDDDKACDVNCQVEAVRDTIRDIKGTVKLMDQDFVGTLSINYAPAPGPAPAPDPYAWQPLPPPGLMVASAPVPPPPAAAIIIGPQESVPNSLENRCEQLTQLTKDAVQRIQAIKDWAKKDGIREERRGKKRITRGRKLHETGPQEIEEDIGQIEEEVAKTNPDDPEAKDPDLVFSLKGVMSMGDKLQDLIEAGKFCTRPSDEEEDDDDPIEDDLEKNPEKNWTSDDEDDYEGEVDEDEDVVKVNESAVFYLLEWEGDTSEAVEKFETEVHPHGYKWWRYRYEYTVIESLVIAWSLMVLYIMLYLMRGASFNRVHKFYKTGLPQRIPRYAYVYFVFHAAALMTMVTVSYMLYMPWGRRNIFNWFATLFHEMVDGRANVPFLGYSWLYMFLDVQFQLFVCFALYTFFVWSVIQNFINALREWKTLDSEGDNSGLGTVAFDRATGLKGRNVTMYTHLESIVIRRLRSEPEYRAAFEACKLTVPGVEGLDVPMPGWQDFKLHLLLTEALGKATEYLVEVSLTTLSILAIATLIVAWLANHYQVAFMYFLPGFLIVMVLFFGIGYFTSRYMRMLSDDDKYKKKNKWANIHLYCRCIQILLYCVFFSFSRLLLSNDIFEFYEVVYISALIGLIVICVLLAVFAGEVIKETACALILPPHISGMELRCHLENIVQWHMYDQCHECGAIQMPANVSYCKEWAGRKPLGARPHEVIHPGSARPYSWRG